jgi:hypothetical protein
MTKQGQPIPQGAIKLCEGMYITDVEKFISSHTEAIAHIPNPKLRQNYIDRMELFNKLNHNGR